MISIEIRTEDQAIALSQVLDASTRHGGMTPTEWREGDRRDIVQKGNGDVGITSFIGPDDLDYRGSTKFVRPNGSTYMGA